MKTRKTFFGLPRECIVPLLGLFAWRGIGFSITLVLTLTWRKTMRKHSDSFLVKVGMLRISLWTLMLILSFIGCAYLLLEKAFLCLMAYGGMWLCYKFDCRIDEDING
jgi:hypothetical protein